MPGTTNLIVFTVLSIGIYLALKFALEMVRRVMELPWPLPPISAWRKK